MAPGGENRQPRFSLPGSPYVGGQLRGTGHAAAAAALHDLVLVLVLSLKCSTGKMTRSNQDYAYG